MPSQLTYPGVYVEEIPSGVRTITGVATSITAFMGRTQRGPTEKAMLISSFSDFERLYGGLWAPSELTFTVADFFLNGGSQAVIVRLYTPPDGASGRATATVNGLKLTASSPGTWGNRLEACVDKIGITAEVAARYGLPLADLFNLSVREKNSQGEVVARERLVNMSFQTTSGARRVDRILEQDSQLVRLQFTAGVPDLPSANPAADDDDCGDPAATYTAFTTGDNGGALVRDDYGGAGLNGPGVKMLEEVDLFNLLCIPPDVRGDTTSKDVYSDLLQYCVRRRAMLIVDAPAEWDADSKDDLKSNIQTKLTSDIGLNGTAARNAALFYPRVVKSDPLSENQPDVFVPCGIAAGVMARTDTQRGVWKAPAGLDAALAGVSRLETKLSDADNGAFNPLGINCLRTFPIFGHVVWGSRTLRGADQLADEYKYIPVRRLALYIEESLFRGLQWVVFEPNDEPLWAQIRLNVGAFMHDLFRQGAFQGTTPREAYFVKCDRETTTQFDRDRGIVNILVGFAPLKPAEFVVIKLQQIAGQTQA